MQTAPSPNPTAALCKTSREEYEAIDRVNWSTLKELGKSPAHYRHQFLERKPSTDAMKRGRAVHMAVFEPDQFLRECIVWEGGTRRGKEWEAFKAKHSAREILTQDEHYECMSISAAVRANRHAARYLENGKGEHTLLWNSAGLDCKGRVDFIANCGAIVDLKTTRDASPEAFGKTVYQYGYLAQAAFYADGYAAITGTHLPYIIVCVETGAPYVSQVYRLSGAHLQMGRDVYEPLLERLKTCREAASWPGYADGELELELPRWAAPHEEDATALDLVINHH